MNPWQPRRLAESGPVVCFVADDRGRNSGVPSGPIRLLETDRS